VHKTFKFFLFLIIFSQVLPVGVFASPKAAQTTMKSVALSPQLVKVTVIKPAQTITTGQVAAAATASCVASKTLEANLVQGNGGINLNQPASCFSLSQGHVVASGPLIVVSAKPLATIIVVNHSAVFESPYFMPQPYAKEGALPVLAFAASALFIFEERKKVKNISFALFESPKKLLTVYQLQVIRC
jgi:hypothetical protein